MLQHGLLQEPEGSFSFGKEGKMLYKILFKLTEWLLGGKGSLDRLADVLAGGEE